MTGLSPKKNPDMLTHLQKGTPGDGRGLDGGYCDTVGPGIAGCWHYTNIVSERQTVQSRTKCPEPEPEGVWMDDSSEAW